MGKDEVTLDTSVDDLGDDLLVGKADNKTVFGGVAGEKFRTKLWCCTQLYTYYLFFA